MTVLFVYLQLHVGVPALMLMLAMFSNDFLQEYCVLMWFGCECHGRFMAQPLRPARRLSYIRVRGERLGPLRRCCWYLQGVAKVPVGWRNFCLDFCVVVCFCVRCTFHIISEYVVTV